MNLSAQHLLQAALSLPESDRADLADALFASLPPENEPLCEEWLAEIARRSQEYDSGLVKPIPWSEIKSNHKKS